MSTSVIATSCFQPKNRRSNVSQPRRHFSTRVFVSLPITWREPANAFLCSARRYRSRRSLRPPIEWPCFRARATFAQFLQQSAPALEQAWHGCAKVFKPLASHECQMKQNVSATFVAWLISVGSRRSSIGVRKVIPRAAIGVMDRALTEARHHCATGQSNKVAISCRTALHTRAAR